MIGEAAKAQITSNPTNTVFDAKRLIGRKYHEPLVQEDLKHWPFTIVPDETDKPIIEVEYLGERKKFSCGRSLSLQSRRRADFFDGVD